MENQNIPQVPVQGQQVVVVKNNFWKGFFVGILTVLVIVGAWFAVTIFILCKPYNPSWQLSYIFF